MTGEKSRTDGRRMDYSDAANARLAAEKKCYTVREVQDMLGISRPVVYDLIREKKFRTIIIARRYMIIKKSFDAWLDGLDTVGGSGEGEEPQ